MQKRKRPHKHYRIVQTKKGKKKVLVNKNIPKTKGRIKTSERKFFKHISNPKQYRREFGGEIDFQKDGTIEFINLYPGEGYNVDIPDDYEVQFHTHPDKDVSPPTPEDIMALIHNKNQQAEVVWRDGKAFIILKTSKSKALSKLPTTQLFQKLDKAFFSSRKGDWEQNWKKELEKLGFIVYINNKSTKPMNIKVTPKE